MSKYINELLTKLPTLADHEQRSKNTERKEMNQKPRKRPEVLDKELVYSYQYLWDNKVRVVFDEDVYLDGRVIDVIPNGIVLEAESTQKMIIVPWNGFEMVIVDP